MSSLQQHLAALMPPATVGGASASSSVQTQQYQQQPQHGQVSAVCYVDTVLIDAQLFADISTVTCSCCVNQRILCHAAKMHGSQPVYVIDLLQDASGQLSGAMQRRIQHNLQLAARCARLEAEKQQLVKEKVDVSGE